ncbi:hypothetical protein AB0O07_21685 [Streptomyces sp. NPDC093085]|uniref:hypothetical protein n=1 Tax=Streptomyces sp. NPDC093085 TaxID=3155068 RepID=UPI00343A996E
MGEAFIAGDGHHAACGICPSRRFPLGEFDVAERPSPECPFDPEDGHRYTAARVPVCVHPDRVGLPPAPYKSEGAALTAALPLPPTLTLPELVPYLRAVVHGAAPALLGEIIERAASEIPRMFPEADAIAVLRRALG